MALDASIYSRFAPKSVAEFDAEAYNADNARQANALNQLRLLAAQRTESDAQRTLGEQQGVRNALASLGAGATDEQRVNALMGLGTQTAFGQADTLRKAMLERQKTEAQTGEQRAKTEAEAFKTAHGRLQAFNDLLSGVGDQASYDAALGQAQRLGYDVSREPRQFDPAYVAQAKARAVSEQQRVENAAKQRGFDLQAAGQQQALSIAQMNDARVRAEGAANRGVTMRGQDMADSRARELAAAAVTKPFEVTGPDGQPVLVQQDKQGNITPVQGYAPKQSASKPLTESQAKALLFATRMQQADQALGDMAKKGVGSPSLGQQLTGGEGLLGMAATAMASPEQQQVDQAQRDFLNAVLRRESGAAISQSEFSNARKQYFAQPGDSPQVLDQKMRNRQTAINGLFAEVPEGRRNSVAGAAPKPAAKPLTGVVDFGSLR